MGSETNVLETSVLSATVLEYNVMGSESTCGHGLYRHGVRVQGTPTVTGAEYKARRARGRARCTEEGSQIANSVPIAARTPSPIVAHGHPAPPHPAISASISSVASKARACAPASRRHRAMVACSPVRGPFNDP